MSVFNQSRSGVIKIIFGIVFLIIIGQLVNLQVISKKYKIEADNNAIYRRIIYPDRGIIFDRKKRALLENTITYDLVVTPNETKGTDTLGICDLLNIDTATYRKRIKDIIFKNGSVRPSVFEPLLTPELYARLNENMYKFPGFVLSDRSVRSYPFNTGAAFLGYTSEVDTSFLRKHKDEGYESGDYVGFTGLERSYEKVLMGKRGVKRFIRDNKGRIQGPFEKGEFDTTAVAGKNLYSSIDVELQQLGEKLMTNKVGSIVAIDPRTGGILCMISAPTYNPNYLTGNQRKKHINEMILDPRLPFNNRALGTKYSPGSTFKTVVGVAGLAEGVINKHFTVSCSGAFYGCNNGKPKCLDRGTFDFVHAIAVSDNTYFATVYKKILDQYKYGSTDSSLKVFNSYASSFGLGNKLGVDLPAEKRGNLPLSADYHKKYGNSWNACTIISNSIGQGEVQTTLVQLANVMATIANKGWYYTPHIIDSIEGGDEYGLLDSFKIKRHTASNISDTVFDAVQDGMQGVMDYGTGQAEKIPGFVVCGKTGTVENYDHGKKQKDHAFFGGFAPRTNPRIAIAVMCENAGFGAASAAPIASLMMERYLKDTIPEKDRQDKVEQIAKTNLIPALMRAKLAQMDSLKLIKEAQMLELQKEKETQDTLEDDNIDDSLINKPKPIGPKPANNNKKVLTTSAAILTDERKYFSKKNAKA
ncbi:penicillin-binding protein 2 [Parasediminibacterium paludis]|uniref:Penicillin-binding protein 2 n=1 Tax=Parasediminibacterium paludis TaxID=908966 RepID=A0ABV8PY01_9BACT